MSAVQTSYGYFSRFLQNKSPSLYKLQTQEMIFLNHYFVVLAGSGSGQPGKLKILKSILRSILSRAEIQFQIH